MQLGWIDYSLEERETIKELLKALNESGSLDELGVGIVRDSISDVLYPGTSVLHTRAKYYILIPELFRKAMGSGLITGGEVRNLINSDQDKIARALRRAIDEETGTKEVGIIGGRSDRAVKMKPTRIYWNALRTTQILCRPEISFDDACDAVADYNRNNQNSITLNENENNGGDDYETAFFGLALFTAPCKEKIEDYLKKPTLKLRNDEADYLMNQFLRVPIMKNTLMEYCLKTKQSFANQSLEDIQTSGKTAGMSDELKYNLKLATEFANFIFGAYIVYNLMFYENGGERATEEEKVKLNEKYTNWKRMECRLPHREQILKLVKGHDPYKVALREFLRDFESAVDNNASNICSDEEKRIIKQREMACKTTKAKLGKDYPFQEIQTSPMSYRHGTAQVIISDILEGLVRGDA